MVKIYKAFVLLPLILNIVVLRSTRSEIVIKTSSKLHASPDALKELAQELSEFLVDEGLNKACSLHILGKSLPNYEPPPQVKVLCHSQSTVVVGVKESKHQQLVVLIPEASNIIEFGIIEPNETTKIFALYKQQYQIFSTVLAPQCHHGMWGQGPLLKNKLKNQQPNSKFAIEVKRIGDFEYTYINDSMVTVSASFTWNSVLNECTYNIINSCASKIQNDFEMKEFIVNEERRVTFENISLGDECEVTVFGKGTGNNGKLRYFTPKCSPFNISQPCVSERPDNVVITAEESDSGDGWNIIVKWSKPEYAPINYTILLISDSIQNITVPGNATQAIFRNVEYTTNITFNIKISARYPLSTEVVNKLGMFPLPYQKWTGSVASSGAWVGVLLLATAAAAISCARVRIRDKRIKLYFPEEKGEKEALEPSAGQDTNRTTSDSWEMLPERLQLLQVLGEGAFGIVRKGTLTPGTKEVAVKMLKEFPSVEEVRSFRAEMDLMKSVGGHPHVVSLVGCCSGRRPCIVAEYCSRGDLLNYLRCAWDVRMSRRNAKYYNNNIEFGAEHLDELVKSKEPKLYINKMYDLQGVCDEELTAVDLLSFCRQIAMGMEFLASNRVVHRDLAARNILVCDDKTLKIADFGLSRDVYQDNQYKQKGNCKLPVKWMAIESLVHRLYTTQSDVWSFGVVMWEVVTLGGSPYPGVAAARLPRLLRLGYRMPKPNNCAQLLYRIMLSCWSGRPRERPTFSDLRAELETLLHGEAADYLTPQVDYEDRPPPCKFRSFFNRNKLSLWPLHKMEYERQVSTSNHYTFTPNMGRTQVA